jgi:serine/threonine protein kinase
MFVGHPPFRSTKSNRNDRKMEIYDKALSSSPDFTLNEDLRKSHLAQAFIQMCLSKNLEDRWNSCDLLEHPWFKTILEEANEAYKEDYEWLLLLIEHMKKV